jgi:glyoxal oxidase-like protein/WSC domain-containing protein
MLCNGNSSEYCGGGNRLNVYQAASTIITAPSWKSMGCYAEGTNGRALPNGAAVPGGAPAMTVELCQAACLDLGYTLAGVEYSQECWCGNAFANGGAPAPDGDAGCNQPCKGNTAEICGGNSRLNVYSYSAGTGTTTTSTTTTTTPAVSAPSGWVNMGCYTDPGPRTLLNQIIVNGAMTVELCIAGCAAEGYTIAGVEYAGECWCDTQFRNLGAPTTSGCNMPCNGNAQEMCGGPNRLNVYQQGGTPASTTATSATSATTTTTSIPTVSGVPNGWSYEGCYVDNSPMGRILAVQQPDSTQNSMETCIAACAGLGYNIAGMEYGVQCFCDKVVHYGAPLASADSECGMACAGASTEKCGGPNRVSLYSNGNFTINPTPVVQTSGLPGKWKYVGCAQDLLANNEHLLPNQLILTDINSPTTCLGNCSYFGYAAGALEYGDECYCGDPIPNPIIRPESECETVCPGNVTAMCGGGARMNYYEWQGDGLAEFAYPTGNAAGQYEFLIGGVVVPLMTTVNINGKIMFLEKHGTGAPNSTGAYEFDPYYENDFSNAWRTLNGLKTDVFCSAGLVLPDKTGRQLTIGGWSAESLSGVRLYTPSGSPGSVSTTDWQENVAEVSLQAARWYPTAMIMANGTILVVGGEIGSNDKPQPSLELLPRVGPVLPMEWLVTTDPYNLYPFLVVLPSGGIFVAYYNEARILNEVTFDTIRTLPNIPAGVTSQAGGRTYPLEGTMMILPQNAPYTDPLRVIICGGSTPFTGQAIDNCVSISPEDPADVWLVERMVSNGENQCFEPMLTELF